jgi:uncharacterized protein
MCAQELRDDSPIAIAVTAAIHRGDAAALDQLLAATPGLATARIVAGNGAQRTLLHIATDWPGHFPDVARTIAALLAAGADVNAPFIGAHQETALHWAASSDDIAALDALLEAGAAIDAPGGVIAGGTPLDDAVAFGQWKAAARLVERGARTSLWNAAALGLLDRVASLAAQPTLPPAELTNAFWCACHGGQRATAEYLLDRGADLDWVGHDRLTPLDAAERAGASDLAAWLRSRGARSAGAAR